MRKKKFEHLIARQVYAEENDFIYLKKHGYSISDFFRQAIKAHKEVKWNYEW